MNPIDTHRINGVQARLVTGQAAVVRTGQTETVKGPAGNVAGTITANPVNAGSSPVVDTDRVAVIRKAVEEGNYPITPARIADAMIAAGYLLRVGK